MKVKVIKNSPLEDGASNISRHIGKVFEVIQELQDENIYVRDDGGDLKLYKGEFEIVDGLYLIK